VKIEINKEMAIQLAESKFWETMSAKDIALFQLEAELLCMPFEVFHKAIEEALNRPVYTHEMGLNWKGLREELLGEKEKPTFDEIINLIPKDKRIIILED